MEPQDAAAWQAHADGCASCGRYDSVLRRGLQLVRELPVVEPSACFYTRLRERLAEPDPEVFGRPRLVGATLSLALAGMIALLAWSPPVRDSLLPGPSITRGAAAVDPAPAGERVAGGPQRPVRVTPVVVPADATGEWLAAWSGAWSVTPARVAVEPVAGPVVTGAPGPHSPLVVLPPAYAPREAPRGAILVAYPQSSR